MSPALFAVKRLHLRIVEQSKRVTNPFGLTPARFDLMRILAVRDGALQKNIVWLLGVSNATVSRMLKSLEERKLVKRKKYGHDGRCNEVMLTARGWIAYEMAADYCLDSRKLEQMTASAITGDLYANVDSARVREKVCRFEDALLAGRKVLRDRSPVRHPWSNEDFVTLEMLPAAPWLNLQPLRRRRRPKAPSPKELRPWEIPPSKDPRLFPTQFLA